MNEKPELLSKQEEHDVEEFLFNVTSGDGDTAISLIAAARLFACNPRLAPLLVRFHRTLQHNHVKDNPTHSESCGGDEYEETMWKSVNDALPFNSIVRDYIDFVVDD